MQIRPASALVFLTLTCLTACGGGRAARNESQALLEGQSGEKWFCQVAQDLENWDCVQSDRLAAAPQPERMPIPRTSPDDEPDPGLGLPPTRSGMIYDPIATAPAVAPETAAVPDPAPPPPAPEAEPAPEPEPDAAPMSEPDTEEASEPDTEPASEPQPQAETVVALAGADPDPMPSDSPTADGAEDSTEPKSSPETLVAALPRLDPEGLADEAFLIQLVAMRSVETLERVIHDRGLNDLLAAQVAANGQVYHVLLVGPYADEVAAQEVAAAPPEELADFQLWVRSARSVKKAMREADALVTASERP